MAGQRTQPLAAVADVAMCGRLDSRDDKAGTEERGVSEKRWLHCLLLEWRCVASGMYTGGQGEPRLEERETRRGETEREGEEGEGEVITPSRQMPRATHKYTHTTTFMWVCNMCGWRAGRRWLVGVPLRAAEHDPSCPLIPKCVELSEAGEEERGSRCQRLPDVVVVTIWDTCKWNDANIKVESEMMQIVRQKHVIGYSISCSGMVRCAARVVIV